MLSIRRRVLLKNIGVFLLYGVTFSVLRDALQSVAVRDHLPDIPEVSLSHSYSFYNESKLGLLIENRPSNTLAPLLLHFMAVIPPEWKFRFLGSFDSVNKINGSAAIREHVRTGKLDLAYIPSELTTSGQEAISDFLTDPWVVEQIFWPAEWLLLFQTDSMICANHKGSIDDWLNYSWVGAPWVKHSRYGGNGGFSLRRVSAMKEVLRYQQREDNSEPEDVWLSERIGHLPGAKTPNGEESMKFSVETMWHDEPMGYHIGGSGTYLFSTVWAAESRRNQIYEHCPEIQIVLDMDVENMMDVCPDAFSAVPWSNE